MYDPFAGSFTTGIACEMTGRRCYAIEINPAYVDVCIQRWQDFTEEQATELLKDCPAGCVLVSHSPPKGAVDISSSGRSLGSIAVREVILSRRPKLVVCGHIHASGGQSAVIQSIVVINAGPSGREWTLS